MKTTIHLVDDEQIIHDIFRRIFREPEFELIISENKAQAKSNHHPDIDVVIMDLMIPGTSGLEVFRELKKDDPAIQGIFLTAFGTIETAIEAIKMGAADYLTKPFNNLEIRHRIERLAREKRLGKENIQLRRALGERFSFDRIIGQSAVLRKVLSIIESVADSNSTLLITGESGTGKELVAKAIYQNSNRRNAPYFAFNSSNIPQTLFESLLFGYKKGAYTGADTDKKGIFEEADGGILFFDEIANLTPETQAKILRVIQEKEIQPLGSNRTMKVDVRILAATNVDLRQKVEEGAFREDLFYRLNIINLHLPPLRDRKEDIPLLLDHFLKKFAAENHKTITGVTPDYIDRLMHYDWPGNVRELENAVLRSVLLCAGDSLTLSGLPPEVSDPKPSLRSGEGSFHDQVEQFKRRLIRAALDQHDGVQSRAAAALGLKASTLSELMKRLEIRK